MRNSAQFTLTANVKLYELPANFTYADYQVLEKHGELDGYLRDEGKNLVVDAGLVYVLGLMTAANSGSFTYCGVGSNSTAVTSGDTTLNTEISSRVAVTNRYLTSLSAKFDTFFATTDCAGTWLETALFTASSSGTMLCRKIISSFVKSSSNTAVIAWTITGAAV